MGFPEEDIEREFDRLRTTMVDMMKSLFDRARPAHVRGSSFEPAMDVYETSEALIIVIEIAGTQREDIEIHLEGRRLRIAGIRRVAAPLDAQRCHQMEINFGSFERWVSLDFLPPRNAIAAVYQDGFLRITVPRSGEAGASTIQILTE